MCSSMCECSVCDTSCSSLSFHRFVLWSLMSFVMSSFSCFRFGSVCFVLRRLFLVLMRSLIGTDSIEFCAFTCPLGMWCLVLSFVSLLVLWECGVYWL